VGEMDEESEPCFPGGCDSRSPQLIISMCDRDGRKPTSVKRVANFGSLSGRSNFFHLMRTLEAHQKLATLSSNNPRLNGNIRMRDWRNTVGKDWNKKGEKMMRNVITVVIPILTKRTRLNPG